MKPGVLNGFGIIALLVLLIVMPPTAHGQSLYFDGVNDRADIPDDQSYAAADQSFTVECWVNLDGSAGTRGNLLLVGNYASGGQTPFFGLWAHSDGLVSIMLRSPTLGQKLRAVASGVMDGAWHHLAGVRDVTAGTIALYVDGALADSRSGDPGDLRHGQDLSLATHYGGFTRGHIDDVRVWSVARGAQEIQQDMNSQVSPQPDLVGYWTLDEGSGSTIADSSGNGNSGTLGGDPTWDAATRAR